jgi:hypothetical protein
MGGSPLAPFAAYPPRTPSGYETASTLNSPPFAKAKSPGAAYAPLATAPVAKHDYPS